MSESANSKSNTLTIPLQPLTTVSDTHHGQALEIPENLWRAIDIWQHIKDDEVAARVGAIIQQRLNDLRR